MLSVVSLVAVVAILLRVTSRLTPAEKISVGSPTNELMRHLLFVLLAANYFEFAPAPILISVILLNSISMLAPLPMPYMIRSLAKSVPAVGLVNVALLMAWLVPWTTPIIAFCFFASYLVSFSAGGIQWFKRA